MTVPLATSTTHVAPVGAAAHPLRALVGRP